MKTVAGFCLVTFPLVLLGQAAPSQLPEVTVYSSRVANQAPAGTFAMPVSALRYEPQLDIQARNFAEGQADITIRGGIFENTAFRLGAATLLDPQTGHYLAELPVAPAMLTAPEILTGAPVATGVTNATAGAVSFGWRPIRTAGAASVGAGEHHLLRGEAYQGVATSSFGAASIGADVAIAHSESDGVIPFGEHEFNRVNARVQRVAGAAQTDLFAGYQAKKFGWPNMYTPFNSNETENLETVLLALNHRVGLGAEQFAEVSAYHRRNKDDYAFNRFAPLGAVHPFQHTTWISGAAAAARTDLGALVLNARAEVLADELKSTSLTFGRYHTRTLSKIAVVPERTWASQNGSTTVKAGASFDDSNRDTGAWSPIVEISRALPSAALRRLYLGYAKTSQVPTYTALNSSATAGLFRGNPNLGRETSHNLEAGASGTLAGWATDVAIFWRRDNSLVDWTFRRGVTARTANAVDVDVAGLTLISRRSWQRCDVVLGYTALTKDADYRGANVDASFYALNYARHRLTAAFTCRLGGGVELRLDNVARIQADNALRAVGGDEALSTSVGLAFRPIAIHALEVSLNVDNVWNSNFQEVPAVPAARRQISVGVGYTW